MPAQKHIVSLAAPKEIWDYARAVALLNRGHRSIARFLTEELYLYLRAQPWQAEGDAYFPLVQAGTAPKPPKAKPGEDPELHRARSKEILENAEFLQQNIYLEEFFIDPETGDIVPPSRGHQEGVRKSPAEFKRDLEAASEFINQQAEQLGPESRLAQNLAKMHFKKCSPRVLAYSYVLWMCLRKYAPAKKEGA